jgi:Ca-activated chloride channel family protein
MDAQGQGRNSMRRVPRWRGWLLVVAACGGLALLGFLKQPSYSQPNPPKGVEAARAAAPADIRSTDVTQGALRARTGDGFVECPLRHTDVRTEISGYLARVTVTQTFQNPFTDTIEAVYVFPLSHSGAVDQMSMLIDDRRIVGVMKRREEAKRLYQQAVQQGKTASLLEQERPNIFTQSVGNIPPGEEVRIEISYVDVLDYDKGTYEFRFPMVVGPRYNPGAPISCTPEVATEHRGAVHEAPAASSTVPPTGGGFSPDTDRVPDASRITPQVLKRGSRTGHDISLQVQITAGVPIHDLAVTSHAVDTTTVSASQSTVALAPGDRIPNKDFVLRYSVLGPKPEMAMLAHRPESGDGYFMLMIQPKLEATTPPAPPREMVFLVDVSGSMQGEPTAKVKETMRQCFKHTRAGDTVQVVTFAGEATQLFPQAVPVTRQNITRALDFTDNIQAGGGTEMLKGVTLALDAPKDPKRVRIVVLLTDGYIGNEAEILAATAEKCGDAVRCWGIGIGSAPNSYLIDGVAKQGGGMSLNLNLNDDPAQPIAEAMERIHRAQFAHIVIDWGGLQVSDIYPTRIPELWADRPVILHGRYTRGGKATIRLKGRVEGTPVTYPLSVTLPPQEPAYDVLATVWARKKIDDLSDRMLIAEEPAPLKEQIIQLALHHALMTKYTSFVAIDERKLVNTSGKGPRRVGVPVPMPKGVSHEGVFGKEQAATNTSFIGGAGGDPWIRVSAPANARQVVAVFPNGEVKNLRYLPRQRTWSGRFDIPFGTAAGLYRVEIIVVLPTGKRLHYTLRYANLIGCGITAQATTLCAHPGQRIPVQVTGTGIQRAVVVTPWGERTTLASGLGNAWHGDVTVPKAWATGEHTLTVVLLDGAHNRTEISLDLLVK